MSNTPNYSTRVSKIPSIDASRRHLPAPGCRSELNLNVIALLQIHQSEVQGCLQITVAQTFRCSRRKSAIFEEGSRPIEAGKAVVLAILNLWDHGT